MKTVVRRRWLTRLFLVTTLSLSLGGWRLWMAPAAAAAGYNYDSQGDCASGYPRASSWLNWWGYFYTSSGATRYMELVYYNPDPFIVGAPPEADAWGSDNAAVQDTSAAYASGTYWVHPGEHTSSFFNGPYYDYDKYFSCP